MEAKTTPPRARGRVDGDLEVTAEEQTQYTPTLPKPQAPLQSALAYAELGWFVFPVNRDKSPKTSHGVLDATTDPLALVNWWRTWPDAGIGIALGRSGLVALDTDPRHGGQVHAWGLTVRELDTTRARTQASGSHHIYLAPSGNWSKSQPGPGRDLLAGNAYIVVAPSRGPIGSYAWEPGFDPRTTPPKPLPAAIVKLLKTGKTRDSSTRTTPSPIYGAKLEKLLGELCADLDTADRQGYVSSPFAGAAGDSSPSFHYDLDAGVWYDFAGGSSMGGHGGGYYDLAKAARLHLGYLTTPSSTGEEAAPPALPWEPTEADRISCPKCGQYYQKRTGRRIWRGRTTCKGRDCEPSQKRRAGEMLEPVTTWQVIFTREVDKADWRGIRELVRRKGGQNLGIPLPGGRILAVTSVRTHELQPARNRQGLYQELFDAFKTSPKGSRICRPHGMAPKPKAAAEGLSTKLSANDRVLPEGIRSRDFALVVDPPFEVAVRDMHEHLGIAFHKHRGGELSDPLTDAQLFRLKAETFKLRGWMQSEMSRVNWTTMMLNHLRANDAPKVQPTRTHPPPG